MKNGGPAFPRSAAFGKSEDGYDTASDPQEGMTLRDYFAAAAITGMKAFISSDYEYPDDAAKKAYKIADAMLKAREAK